MNQTPIYSLGYFIPNMVVGDDLDLDKNRFTTIESQLYNLYNIFGNGILDVEDSSGQQLPSWELSAIPGRRAVQISSGKGHVNYKYAETTDSVTINLTLPSGTTSGNFWYYFYAVENSTTGTNKTVDFVALTNQSLEPSYVGLGAANLIVNSVDSTFTLTVHNSEEYGRQEISLFSSLTGLVKNHVHIGGTNNPSPIDLGKHVTGFLTAENIDNLDLNAVTQGVLDPNRLPTISHEDLTDIGTLTHEQIDAILASIQNQNDDYKLSEYGIVNRLQIILALKKQNDFFNIDGGQLNSIYYMPYLLLQDFVDTFNTTAVVNNEIHRVFGVTGLVKQTNVVKLNSTQEFKTALFYAQDSVVNPSILNIAVTGVATLSAEGTLNTPYGLTGSANTIYVSAVQDSFVSSFSTTGTYLNRRIDFDPFLNLNSPFGLWFDSTTNYLYIADTFNHRIVVTDNNLVNLIAKIGANDASGVPGPGYGVGFNYPKSVYGLGNTFYVSDSGNNMIQKYNWVSGVPVYSRSFSYDDNSIVGINQTLNDPRGMFATIIGSDNYLFLSDYGNHRVLCGMDKVDYYEVYQTLGKNSAGLGIYNTSLITYTASSNVLGVGASFVFYNNFNGGISSIGVANSGNGYSDNDIILLNYNGVLNGNFTVLTDGAGHITTAYTTYGFSTSDLFGFNHPQSIAVDVRSNKNITMLIADTDNDRVVSYRSIVGVGTTSGNFVYNYSFGTTGSGDDTSSIIYFQRPTAVYAQQGFSTIFISDSVNNRIHGLSTSFAPSLVLGGITTSVFGIGDTTLSEGGITLTQPLSYLGIATATPVGENTPAGWYVGETISQNTQTQSDDIHRYNYYLFPQKTLTIQDTFAVAIATLNEDSNKTLGSIGCYLIFSDSFSAGDTIQFSLTNNTNRSKIKISDVYTLRSNGDLTSEIYEFVNINLFTDQPNPPVIGFGFLWSTDTGWTNAEVFQLGWNLPIFSPTIIQDNYPLVATYRQQYGLNDSIFTFNANRYSSGGVFVFRFDSGVAEGADYDYVIYNFNTPSSSGGQSTIQFYYRTGDTLDEINSNNQKTALYPVSGASAPINTTSRYIDLMFYLGASNFDALAAPNINSISLFYSVYGESTGIVYDTNVNNAPVSAYPRFKWSQGSLYNVEISPVLSSSTQSYEISIKNTSDIGKYAFLSDNNIQFGIGSTVLDFVDTNNNLYLSPYQNFASLEPGLLNPQHFTANGSGGYMIADTDNDRLLEIDENGLFVKAVQGNIRLPQCDRAFAVLGAFYNPSSMHLYVPFSQYVLLGTNYANSLSIEVNGTEYNLSNESYFDQDNMGLYNINSNSQSAVFYASVTSTLGVILDRYPNQIYFKIQNTETSPPFQVPNTGRSEGNEPENETITYSNVGADELVFNDNIGIGTLLDYAAQIKYDIVDPVVFGDADETSTVLWSFVQGTNYEPVYSTFYNIPVYYGLVFFDNIFKPIHVDYTDNGNCVLSCVGNAPIRSYNSSFELNYKINEGFVFNEKLGGSTVVLDRGIGENENIILVAQPGLGTQNIVGQVFVFNRNVGAVLNSYLFSGYDAVKAEPLDNDYVVLINDRIGFIRSKLVKIANDGRIAYSTSSALTRPVSLKIQEDGNYYVTDITGQYGNIYFRSFTPDGNAVSSGTNNINSSGNAGGVIVGGGTGGGTNIGGR